MDGDWKIIRFTILKRKRIRSAKTFAFMEVKTLITFEVEFDHRKILFCFRYGGTYLDSDVISQTSINAIGRQNYACSEIDRAKKKQVINGAILNFDKVSGHRIAALLIE